MQSDSVRRSTFRQLHQSGCFVIPNPWDIGSARFLAHLGFPALATTSAGFAFSRGLSDSRNAVGCDEMLRHIQELTGATSLPVNADFGAAYADDPEGVAGNVKRCVATGVAGLSVEDSTDRTGQPLYDFQLALDRVYAARAAIDETQSGVLLTARTECYLTGHPQPFEEAMRRLQAFANAGADVLYAPGVSSRDEIKAIVESVAPKPVNLLMSADTGMMVNDIAELGVRRISVGSSLARAAWSGFMNAANLIAREGSFAGFKGIPPFREINGLFEQVGREQ